MGLDGFSMSNLGLHRNLTTAQLANEMEATAKMALENQLPDVDGVGKKEKAGKKDPEAAFNPMVPFIPDKKKKKDEDGGEDDNSADEDNKDKSTENTDSTINKKVGDEEYDVPEEVEEPRYLFKMSSDNMIEIYDAKTNNVIKKITPEEAASTVHNFTKIPSMFFNKDI